MRHLIIGFACASCVCAGIAGCDRQANRETARQPEAPAPIAVMEPGEEPKQVEVDLETTEDTELEGTAELKQTANGVQITLTVEDATPGRKGVHVHERGDCSDIAAKSMGAHYAPDDQQHGLPYQSPHHLGDLGNIEIGNDGKGRMSVLVPQASLRPGAQNTFLGKAIVVHESEDLGKEAGSAGGSGAPIACGVIDD